MYNLILKRFTNFKKLVSESFKLIERLTMFWNKSKIRPIPNSIAEKTKKKNVKDKTFKLSKITPIKKTIAYKVIQSSSAVNKRWRLVFVFTIILNSNKKKKKINKFKSPITTMGFLTKVYLKN